MKLTKSAKKERDRILDCIDRWMISCNCRTLALRQNCWELERKQILHGQKTIFTKIREKVNKR